MSILKKQIAKVPKIPGIYIFFAKGESASGGKDKRGEILYIGKAANLRSRVSSYFTGPHDTKTEKMISQITKVDYQKTDSVLEALILEANLIKKYQPKYNVKLKDDKSFSYFVITKEEFPRVLILRKTDLNQMSFPRKRESSKSFSGSRISARGVRQRPIRLWRRSAPGGKSGMTIRDIAQTYGPYTSKRQMEIALNIMRKIFPFHSLAQKTEKGCLDFQLGRCPGPYAGAISRQDYQKNIRGIEMILAGRKNDLLKKLKKEMSFFSKHQKFEKAAQLRNKIFALKHIQDIALITREPVSGENIPHRIEAYDISNIFGQYATGGMIVFTNGQINKSEYRKFKIKTVSGIDDVGMTKEVLRRRFKHQEWPLPNLIFIDGGIGQFNGAVRVLEEKGLKIPVVALAKGPTRRGEKIFSSKPVDIKINLIKEIRDEAHRFAISYHRLLRKRGLINKGKG